MRKSCKRVLIEKDWNAMQKELGDLQNQNNRTRMRFNSRKYKVVNQMTTEISAVNYGFASEI